MKIQLPVQVQGAFDRFRKTGSLGEGAQKQPAGMEGLQFSSLRDNLGEVQALDKMDDVVGMDSDPTPGSIRLTPAALQGKPYEKLEACADGADTVLIHKSSGDKQSYEMATAFQGAPAFLTALNDGGAWTIGSNLLVMVDGKPVMTDTGIPKCAGELLIAP